MKIESGFKKIIGHNLAGSFLYDTNHPEYPNLSVIERKVNLHRYHTIYQFGTELRNCFDFYFKLYSDSPDNYIRTYYICEFCEATLKEIEAMPKKIFDKNYMGIPEKNKNDCRFSETLSLTTTTMQTTRCVYLKPNCLNTKI